MPKGSLENSWNLIVRACRDCNAEKAKLEDDISAITMFNQVGDDPRLTAETERKTGRATRGAISNSTGRPVSQSDESITVKSHQQHVILQGGMHTVTGDHLSFAPIDAHMDFGAQLVGPPQIDPPRIEALAQFHIKAMIYFLDQKAGGVFLAAPGNRDVAIMMVNHAPRQDWGNAHQTSFRDQMSSWPLRRILVHAASGYFRCVIRDMPKAPLMAWALEWNKSYRTIGYIGQADFLHKEAGKLTPPTFHQLNATDRYRREECLDESADTLFSFDDAA